MFIVPIAVMSPGGGRFGPSSALWPMPVAKTQRPASMFVLQPPGLSAEADAAPRLETTVKTISFSAFMILLLWFFGLRRS